MINLDSESLFLNEDLFGNSNADDVRQISRGGSGYGGGNDDSSLLDSQLSTDSLGSLMVGSSAQPPGLVMPDSPDSLLWGVNQDQSSQGKFSQTGAAGQMSSASASAGGAKGAKRARGPMESSSSLRLPSDGMSADSQNLGRGFGDDMSAGVGNQWDTGSAVGSMDDPNNTMMSMNMENNDGSQVRMSASSGMSQLRQNVSPHMNTMRDSFSGVGGSGSSSSLGSSMSGVGNQQGSPFIPQSMNPQSKNMQSMNPQAHSSMNNHLGHNQSIHPGNQQQLMHHQQQQQQQQMQMHGQAVPGQNPQSMHHVAAQQQAAQRAQMFQDQERLRHQQQQQQQQQQHQQQHNQLSQHMQQQQHGQPGTGVHGGMSGRPGGSMMHMRGSMQGNAPPGHGAPQMQQGHPGQQPGAVMGGLSSVPAQQMQQAQRIPGPATNGQISGVMAPNMNSAGIAAPPPAFTAVSQRLQTCMNRMTEAMQRSVALVSHIRRLCSPEIAMQLQQHIPNLSIESAHQLLVTCQSDLTDLARGGGVPLAGGMPNQVQTPSTATPRGHMSVAAPGMSQVAGGGGAGGWPSQASNPAAAGAPGALGPSGMQQNPPQRRVMMPQQGMGHQGMQQQGMQQQGMAPQMQQPVGSQGMQVMPQPAMQQPMASHMSSVAQSPHGQTPMQAIPVQGPGMGGSSGPGQGQQMQAGMMPSSGMGNMMMQGGGGNGGGNGGGGGVGGGGGGGGGGGMGLGGGSGILMQGGGGSGGAQPDMLKDAGMQDSDEEKPQACVLLSSTGSFSADLPHPRAHCMVRQFLVSNDRVGSEEGGNNEGYCPNCFCYVCDVKASECQVLLIFFFFRAHALFADGG